VSSFLTKGTPNNVSKGLLNVAPIVNSFFGNQKSLNYVATENFGSLFRIKELKPCLPHKRKGSANSAKRRIKRKAKKYVLPSHKGLLSRIRIVGPRHARRFKFQSANRRHLLRKKSHSNLMRKRKASYIKKADIGRIKKLLPLWKRQNFKSNH